MSDSGGVPPNKGLELTKPAQAMGLRSSTRCYADTEGPCA